jgi:hypothetical protein
MQIALAAPATNERGPRYMEKALAAIHQADHERCPVTLSYGVHEGRVGLSLQFQRSMQEHVTGPILANYPNCSLTVVEREDSLPDHRSDASSDNWEAWTAELALVPELFPVLRHAQFEDMLNRNFADPVSGLLRAIKPAEDSECRIEIIVTPATSRRCRRAMRAVKRLDREFFHRHHRLARYYAKHITRPRGWFLAWLLGLIALTSSEPTRTTLETSTSRLHEREDDLQAASDKVGCHLFETQIRLAVFAPQGRHHEAADRIRQMAGAFGAFTKSRLAKFHLGPIRRGKTTGRDNVRRHRGFLLSHEELATLWHPPTATVLAEQMQTTEFTELEAPAKLDSGKGEGSVPLGSVLFRDDRREFGLALEDRRRHLYIVGKTGMGKTTLLQNMIASDMRTGQGFCLVDPHGDLADSLVGLVPKQRTNDVILFDAGDREFVVGFNPLACPDPNRIDQVTSGVVSAFKKLHDSWGPRLEDTLRNAVFATVEQHGNLMSMMRLLGERTYREQFVPRIRDEVVRSFWLHEFSIWSDNDRTEAVAAIQNKVRPFLTNTNIRAIVSQPGRSLDLRQIMDEGKILIANLSKGRIGEDNSTLLGAFLITAIQQAAMTRADIPEPDRRDFFLYVDEFQNFVSGSFASILSEARKYRLSLVVAHQYLAQLNEPIADAVFGNVGSLLTFQVGSDDAEVLSQQLSKHADQLTPENLTGLPKYTAYTRLLINGMPSNPFSMKTASLPTPEPVRRSIVRVHSRRRYAQSNTR